MGYRMARAKSKFNTDKGEKGGFVGLHKVVLNSCAYSQLSAHDVKLLIDLLSQYNGSNNGDFCATFSLMKPRGWRSKGTLSTALKNLLSAGFIEISRQGGRNLCSLYAVTFYAVDDCKGKLEINATSYPKSLWRKNEPVPDIREQQRLKQAKDDANLLNIVMERAKRENVN